MLRICFFSFLFSAKEISKRHYLKLVFGKGLEERLLYTSVPPKENQNRLKTIYFFFFNYTTLH